MSNDGKGKNELLISDLTQALEVNTKLLEASKRVIVEMTPKAEFYDTIIDDADLATINTASKLLNFDKIGQHKMFNALRTLRIVNAGNTPYQPYIDAGYFKIKYKKTPVGLKPVTLVTPRGLDFIRKKLMEEGYERQSSSN